MQNKFSKKRKLEELINHYSGGKPTIFAKYIGVAPSTISSWLSRDTMDYDLLYAKCENLSPEWLLSGEGEMIKSYDCDLSPSDNATVTALGNIISRQGEEIGRLKERIRQLEGDLKKSSIASVSPEVIV